MTKNILNIPAKIAMTTRFLKIFLAVAVLFSTPLTPARAEPEHPVLGLIIGISGLGDQSFNDMTYAGLIRVKQEHDLPLILEDSDKSEIGFENSMRRLLAKGANIIVANGFYLKDLIRKYAPLYPKRYFILQDAALDDLPNVVSILYSVEEGSFLAGALAGLMTTTNDIGFIGGVDSPIMHDFREGFRQGALYTNPKARLREEFITTAPDFSGFKSPSLGYDRAMLAYREGVDIIYAAAGLSGNGVIQAARDADKFVIGVDSDQDYLAPGHVLTSMMKRLDIATYTEVTRILNGEFSPGSKTYGLKEQGVGLSPMKFTWESIPPQVLTRIETIRNEIINGKIEVFNYLESSQKTKESGS